MSLETRSLRFRASRVLLPALVTFLCLLLLTPARAGSSTPSMEEVQAAYLYNFAKFIEWPDSSFDRDARSFRIGVVGDEAFAEILESTVQGRTIRDRPLVVENLRVGADPKGYHIVFIGSGAKGDMDRILKELDGTGALTVSDIKRFAGRGGAINFVLQGRNVRFEINPEVLERQGLKASSRLMQVALRVGGGLDEGD